jgi:hypothetical protein
MLMKASLAMPVSGPGAGFGLAAAGEETGIRFAVPAQGQVPFRQQDPGQGAERDGAPGEPGSEQIFHKDRELQRISHVSRTFSRLSRRAART